MQTLDAVATTTADETAEDEAGPGRPPAPGSWVRRRALHAVALLLLLSAVALLGDRQDSWTPDDGAYALQVHTLRETGGWAWPYPHTDVDPELEHLPFTHGVVTTEGKAYPYAKLPAWIMVLRASTAVFGEVHGLFVPSMLGVVAAALVAWALASRFDRSAAPWAFWAVGLGPLFVQSTAMWAHTTAAALGGLCALWVIDAARGRRVPLLAAAATLAVLPLIRNEGVLVVAATVAVLGGITLTRPDPFLTRVGRALRRVAPLGAAGLAGVVVARVWAAAVAPGSPARGAPAVGSSYVATRVTGTTRSLLDGAGESAAGSLLALAALLAVLVGGLLVRRRVPPVVSGLVVAAGLVLMAVRSLSVSPYDLAGFFVAAPLVVFAAATRRPGPLGRTARALVAWAGLFAVAVLATQYAEGGSRDWGGRFFLPLTVPVAVVSVLLVQRVMATAAIGAPRRVVAGLAVALVLVPTALGLHSTYEVRGVFGEMTRSSLQPGSPVVVRMPAYLSRVSWRAIPDGDWLSTDREEARDLLIALRETEVGAVTLSGFGADDVEAPGYVRDVRSPTVVVFTPTP